jgi:hypothetical protein
VNKSKNELMVVVTPHIIHPLPADKPTPKLKYPSPFMPPTNGAPPPDEPIPGAPGSVGVPK